MQLKVQLIAQRFWYIYGIDYTETFVLMIRWESLKIFLAIINILRLILIQMNIVRAYFKSALRQNK